jgi:hypothetical protein
VGLTEELQGLLEELSQKTIFFLKAVVDDAMENGEIPGTADNWTLTFGLWGMIEGPSTFTSEVTWIRWG